MKDIPSSTPTPTQILQRQLGVWDNPCTCSFFDTISRQRMKALRGELEKNMKRQKVASKLLTQKGLQREGSIQAFRVTPV